MIELKLLLLFAIICNSNQLMLPPTESTKLYGNISDIAVDDGYITFHCGKTNLEGSIFNENNEYVTTSDGKKRFAKADMSQISFFSTVFEQCHFPRIPDHFKFQQFQNVKTVDLTNINLETYEMKPMWNEKHVTKIIAKTNRLTEIAPEYFPISEQLEDLDLSKNVIQRIDPRTFANAKSLKKLKMANNRISEIVSHCFSVPTLEELDISHNVLLRVNEHAFEGAVNLYVLDLSYNAIRHLKAGTFDNLHKLNELKLKGAGIVTIDSGTFSGQQKLNTIDLSENLLARMDFSQLNLPNIQWFDLSKNKLTEIKGFRKAIMPKLHQMNLLGSDFECSYLVNLMGVRWKAFKLNLGDPFNNPDTPADNKGQVNGVMCKATPID